MLSPTSVRFFGFKSLNHTHLTPALTVFLCDASTAAVYAGRDSGMEHVVKIAQAQDVIVVAADSEVEAMAWVEVRLLLFFLVLDLVNWTYCRY